jgi:hypothetical protein
LQQQLSLWRSAEPVHPPMPSLAYPPCSHFLVPQANCIQPLIPESDFQVTSCKFNSTTPEFLPLRWLMTQWVEKEPELVSFDAYTNELTPDPGHSDSLTLKGSSPSSNSSKPQFLPLRWQKPNSSMLSFESGQVTIISTTWL